MNIILTSGVGTGPTTLAAFDAALRAAGIANYNLIFLSSIIPAGSNLIQADTESYHPNGEWGDRLYVVMASEYITSPITEGWAGVGWVQDQTSGKGLFVEHHGASEEYVQQQINGTLKSMMAARPEQFGDIQMKVCGATYTNQPMCVLVAAVYKAEPWQAE